MPRFALLVLCSGSFAACTPSGPVAAPPATQAPSVTTPRVIPAPVSLTVNGGDAFTITDSTRIVVDDGTAQATRTGELLAAIVRPSTGYAIPISTGPSSRGAIALRLSSDASLGDEGYRLTATRDSVRITANAPAGLYRGTQTLRQLLPAQIESHMKLSPRSWTVPAVTISDQPRFAWRGAMLDVARHFFTVDEVKQYIDLIALYKFNVMHLHLADDQGWRIEIKSQPQLTAVGSGMEVGGGAGGFYTQNDYADLVRYAQDRYITVVPEIDMPGHTNAALIAHPEISCSIRPPAPYTGTEVGWSTFCANNEATYAFIDDVVREIASITPGPYFHMGGDENPILSRADYTKFVERTQDIVTKYGKRMVGWEEISHAHLKASTISQAWASDTTVVAALKYGSKVILSPAKRTYFDMKYDNSTELGLTWAAVIEVRDAYDWDPATYMKGVTETNIIGVETAMWAETVRNITAVQYLAMPRLPALAEVAWTPQSVRGWDGFRVRLASHAPRWNLLGVNYYRSPQIPW
ncbi:MAG: beta-N-acetylhexosaminidase [Gemmatimonadales bacterium]